MRDAEQPMRTASLWPAGLIRRDVLAKSALLFFGIALWHKGLSFHAYYLLPLAWILDGGLSRFHRTIREPLVAGILILCFVLALGILWSDDPKLGFKVWRRYSAFLVFIPYFALLSRERLPWAAGGALAGYFGALFIGLYQWLVVGVQGIPPLAMPYLHFSSMLGIGVILAIHFASRAETPKSMLFWGLAIFLLFVQFGQHARGMLAATLVSCLFLIFLLHRKELKRLVMVAASLSVVIGLFAWNSSGLHERLAQARQDLQLAQDGNYGSSLGYRLAVWDVGMHGIAERPLLGHGTGMAATYFDETVAAYRNGSYQSALEFQRTLHYHNDWIEIGMHTGALGLAAYAFFLLSWLRTFRRHGLGIPGGALICFILILGLTDNVVFFRQIIYLLLVLTGIGIAGATGPVDFPASPNRKSFFIRMKNRP